MNRKRQGRSECPKCWLATLSLLICLTCSFPAIAAPQCVAKDIAKESGNVESIIFLVSKKSVDRLVADGFRVIACPGSKEDAKKLEKLACKATRSDTGPLQRSLEAHYQMTVDELCELTREALKEK